MPKERSYLEPRALPLDSITKGVTLSAILKETQYAEIAEEQKRDVVIVKEAFFLTDPKKRRIGVFTRSDRDHGTKIGQCSTLLCGNFDKRECTVTKDGHIIYDVKDRLRNYISEISGLFVETRLTTVPTIYFEDKERGKRYIFLLFELSCDSENMPLCYRLDNRAEDLFIGMRDVEEVSKGLHRYNQSEFEVDKACIASLPKRSMFSGKFTIAEKIIEAKLASFTLFKFSLIGV